MPPFDTTISRSEARQIYNALGAGLDGAARYEAQARAHAIAALGLAPSQRVLQVGVGTDGEHRTLEQAVMPDGQAVGLDLSRVMRDLTRRRTAEPLCEGDAVVLPFPARCFDRLFAAYLRDLLPTDDLLRPPAEFARVLRTEGHVVLVSLTEGVDLASQLFVAFWKLRFRLNPDALGGRRPLRLAPLIEGTGLALKQREVSVQRGFPSEVVVVEFPRSARGIGPPVLA